MEMIILHLVVLMVLWMDNNGNSFMSGKEKEKSKIDFSCSIYSKYPFTKHVPLIICEAVAVPICLSHF